MLLSLCWTLTSKAQETHHDDSVSSSRGGDEFSWNDSIAADVIKESTLLLGTNQEDAFDFLEISILVDMYYRGFFIHTTKHRYSNIVDGSKIV